MSTGGCRRYCFSGLRRARSVEFVEKEESLACGCLRFRLSPAEARCVRRGSASLLREGSGCSSGLHYLLRESWSGSSN